MPLPADDPPPELFHYTSAVGLAGIIEQRCFRATSLLTVNDSEELLSGIALAKERIAIRAAAGKLSVGSQPRLAELGETLSPRLLENDPDFLGPITICAFSMSEDGDHLGQWRAYCPPEGGYAIGIRTAELRRALPKGWTLVRCRYKADDQQEFMDSLIDRWAEMTKLDAVNLTEGFWHTLLPFAAAIKHLRFQEECEWRAVSAKRKPPELSLRPTVGLLLPYDTVPITTSMISVVRVGPHLQQGLAVAGARAARGREPLMTCRVEQSTIPFRVLR